MDSAIYPDGTRASVLHLLDAALAYYARLGIRFRAVLTDNGVSDRSYAFADRCRELGLKHRRTRPYTPRTNGKAERFIGLSCANGPTPAPTRTQPNENRTSLPGSISTSGIDRMPALVSRRPSAEQHSIRTTC